MRKTLSILIILALIFCSGHLIAQTALIYQKAGEAFFAEKNFQSALESYNKAINKSGKDKDQLAVLYFDRALSYEGLEKPDKALADYSTAISLSPKYRNSYWNRGVIYEHNHDYQVAITDYTTAITLSQNDDNALSILHCNIAFCELKLNKPQDAFKSDSIAITLNPRYGRAYRIRGDIYIVLKLFDSAIIDYTTAIFNDNGSDAQRLSAIYLSRADAKRYSKQNKEAINDYSYAIGLNPDNAVAYWNRGAAYHNNKDYKLATDDYSKAMTYYQKDNISLSKLYDNRATNEMGQNLLINAISDDSVAIVLNPQYRIAYLNKGFAYTQQGNYQQGIDVYEKALDLFEDDKKAEAFIYFEIANNEYFLSEFDKVINDCTMSISLDPTDASSYYYRAKVYLKKTGNKVQAMSDFNKVLDLDTTKKTVNYIFSLFYTNKGDKAAAILQDNLLNTTDNAQLLSDYYNLACLYSLMNKPDEANTYLKIAVDKGYSKKYASADEDLDNIRNTNDYKTIMAAPSN